MKPIAQLYTLAAILVSAIRTATATGTVVDTANATENMITITAGAITDGTHTPKIQAGTLADGSDMADVPAAELIGTALVPITTNSIQKISYIGAKRYLRVVSTVAGATSGGAYAAHIVLKKRKQ